MAGAEVEACLGWLATERNVSASTPPQALSALVVLYPKLLQHRLPRLNETGEARVPPTVQDLLGHADVSTTMIYTHVLKVGGGAVRSPLDAMAGER